MYYTTTANLVCDKVLDSQTLPKRHIEILIFERATVFGYRNKSRWKTYYLTLWKNTLKTSLLPLPQHTLKVNYALGPHASSHPSHKDLYSNLTINFALSIGTSIVSFINFNVNTTYRAIQ
ncbi:hypothetical protein EDB81DRAFT_755220 [Dactylonectria macrodidyma]|uniref:Uncharacterized protein n=1 Tax=Dactylonectria macrodidyma TaxID=307937 RepID=A0A9P9JKI7_9HYPO|nr:hypothetical protein EDB81DRAFT_755220 [Dactylonectria macrodidyma]